MTIRLKCPNCEALTQLEELGDLACYRCLSCGWREESVVARVFANMPASVSALVIVRATESVSASALAKLRSVSALAAAMPINELREQLRSSTGVELGLFVEHRVQDISDLLVPIGIIVETIPCQANHPIERLPGGGGDQ